MKENIESARVILRRSKSMISIILNRPEAINSLSEEMIDIINGYLQKGFRFVTLSQLIKYKVNI